MSPPSTGDEPAVLSPDDAFAVLGGETRMGILQTLGEADGPLSFSELRDRVGMRDSGQFNYHLEKLRGHFVGEASDGYELRQAGRRVIGTVLSGAVTEDPVLDPAPVDEQCPVCDAPTLVAYYQERLDHYCTECEGYYGRIRPVTASAPSDGGPEDQPEYGYLGSVQFPPAGLQGRTPDGVFRAASVWFTLEALSVASGVCPRCSAPLSKALDVCETHDPTDGLCPECDNRHAVLLDFACTNCLYDQAGAFGLALLTDTDVLAFLLDHGINPVSPSNRAGHYAAFADYEEELRSVDPFEAQFTFTIDGDALTLTVDDDLNVVEATR